MSKEEIEKEAEDYAKNLLFVFETDIVQKIVRERVRLALIDVLEPREKQIAELEEKVANLEYLLEGRDNEIDELQTKITEAKVLLKKFVEWFRRSDKEKRLDDAIITEAEQFLNENSAYDRIQKAKYNYAD